MDNTMAKYQDHGVILGAFLKVQTSFELSVEKEYK